MVRIDRTAPTASVTVPAGWQRNPVEVDVDAADTGGSGVGSVTVTVDGVEVAGGPPVEVGGDGEHVVAVTPTDRAGNVGPAATTTVRIDGTEPEIAFGFESGPVEAGTLAAFAVSDTTSGVGAVLASVTDASGTRAVRSGEPLRATGSSTLTVTAIDAAGNVTTASRTVTIGGMRRCPRRPAGPRSWTPAVPTPPPSVRR